MSMGPEDFLNLEEMNIRRSGRGFLRRGWSGHGSGFRRNRSRWFETSSLPGVVWPVYVLHVSSLRSTCRIFLFTQPSYLEFLVLWWVKDLVSGTVPKNGSLNRGKMELLTSSSLGFSSGPQMSKVKVQMSLTYLRLLNKQDFTSVVFPYFCIIDIVRMWVYIDTNCLYRSRPFRISKEEKKFTRFDRLY